MRGIIIIIIIITISDIITSIQHVIQQPNILFSTSN